jgi:hypothetical protein
MSAADLTVRWGIWCTQLGRWLTRDHVPGVAVTAWWPTEREAAEAAKQLNAGRDGAAYVAARLVTL